MRQASQRTVRSTPLQPARKRRAYAPLDSPVGFRDQVVKAAQGLHTAALQHVLTSITNDGKKC